MSKHTEKLTGTDYELVKLLVNDSQVAFAELYVRYKGQLMYFCNCFLKDETSSEDLIQDIFIQIWGLRRNLDPDRSFSSYLHTLARNRVLNMFRQFDVHSRFAQAIAKNQLIANQTEDEIVEKDLSFFLDKAVENLSSKQKEVFKLSRMQGFSYKEISELLQISVPTVQEHASLALKKIKKYLSLHADIYVKLMIILLYMAY
ncbi:MAG: RNA polymerase sigma-70 factor [Bacteroidales bacterium]|jgi:RNA polymerase sigma-70 factor (ECF subfamily)|nr:RNA polymerase sigma-70 factor [Bacteroidales bacterium]